MVASQPNSTIPAARMLLCRVGPTECAIPAAEVREILPIMRLSCPPGLPRLLAGFFQLEGTVIPVIRLARLLDVEPGATKLYTPIVVLRGAKPLAVMVDAMLSLCDIAGKAVVPIAERMLADGVVEHQGRLVSIISPARLLLAAEEVCIDELREREETRLAELNGGAS